MYRLFLSPRAHPLVGLREYDVSECDATHAVISRGESPARDAKRAIAETESVKEVLNPSERSSLTSLENLGECRTSRDDASVLVLAAAASHAEVVPEMQA